MVNLPWYFPQNGDGYVDNKAKMDKIVAAVDEALK